MLSSLLLFTRRGRRLHCRLRHRDDCWYNRLRCCYFCVVDGMCTVTSVVVFVTVFIIAIVAVAAIAVTIVEVAASVVAILLVLSVVVVAAVTVHLIAAGNSAEKTNMYAALYPACHIIAPSE